MCCLCLWGRCDSKKNCWHHIPDTYNLRSFSPPDKTVVHIWLECCDQDIADERMVLGVDTCSTRELTFFWQDPHLRSISQTAVLGLTVFSFVIPFGLVFLCNPVFTKNVLFKILGHIKYQTQKKKMEKFLKLTEVWLECIIMGCTRNAEVNF